MKKATITFITSAALAFAIPLYAADEPGMKSDSQQPAGATQQQSDQMHSDQMQTDQMQTGKMQAGQLITAEELQGMAVVSQEGEEIGEIKNVKIDEQSGEVQFVTISKGGILGMGGDEIAAPLGAFEFGDEQATLTVDQSKLENVPQQTAEVTNKDYQRDLETHYGVAPAWEKDELGDTTQGPQMQESGEPAPQTNIDSQEFTDPQKIDTQN